jgi:aryl-alcohol dehydrogenase-like predicted oxidoreductase
VSSVIIGASKPSQVEDNAARPGPIFLPADVEEMGRRPRLKTFAECGGYA